MMRKYWYIPVMLCGLCGCADANRDSRSEAVGETEVASDVTIDSLYSLISYDEPEKNYLLVEQAVDAWLYFHLTDYKDYQPLIRKTDYDERRDIYVHHLRYRYRNPEGGRQTVEQDFEVNLNTPGEHDIPFHVRCIR